MAVIEPKQEPSREAQRHEPRWGREPATDDTDWKSSDGKVEKVFDRNSLNQSDTKEAYAHSHYALPV
jgi:hypothetical protein